MISWRPITSGSTGLIFVKFSPNGRYLIVYIIDPTSFFMATSLDLRSRDVAMTTNLGQNWPTHGHGNSSSFVEKEIINASKTYSPLGRDIPRGLKIAK